jgi:protein Tex
LRSKAREISFETAYVVSKKLVDLDTANEKLKQKAQKFEVYFDYKESIRTAPAHRLMAVRRGEAEKILTYRIEVDEKQILGSLATTLQDAADSQAFKDWQYTVLEDAYKRLMGPSLETEIRMELKTKSESEAIRVFASNLRHLLLSPPIGEKIVLGVDPGFRTGLNSPWCLALVVF